MGGIPEYKVIFGARSRSDLKEIVTTIRRLCDSSEIAERFGLKLIHKALSLSTLPERGRNVPELGYPDVREIIYKNYRIVYRIRGQQIQVLRFWHAARGTPEINIDNFNILD
jgi:toxin ParE1/3/4